MDYQARLNDILTMLDQGEYLGDGGVESAQEDVTALFLESVGEKRSVDTTDSDTVAHFKVAKNELRNEIVGKWQTNQEDGE